MRYGEERCDRTDRDLGGLRHGQQGVSTPLYALLKSLQGSGWRAADTAAHPYSSDWGVMTATTTDCHRSDRFSGAVPVVELRQVTKSFTSATGSTVVVEDVDLAIASGEKASLVGPSGSGKSTVLSLIAGLLRPDSGTVLIDGIPHSELGERASAQVRADRVGIALQTDNLIPFLSAQENVELALSFSSARPSRRAARARAGELLEGLGLIDRAGHKPRHLSGGETQRVALAVAMANEPALLLADEVVAALDGDTAARVVDMVMDAEFAVLFVTHHVALADRVDTRYELFDRRIVRR